VGRKREHPDAGPHVADEAADAIKTFLQGFAKLPLDSMDESAVLEALTPLKAALLETAENNPHLSALLNANKAQKL
jgi:hypothetical protein